MDIVYHIYMVSVALYDDLRLLEAVSIPIELWKKTQWSSYYKYFYSCTVKYVKGTICQITVVLY